MRRDYIGVAVFMAVFMGYLLGHLLAAMSVSS